MGPLSGLLFAPIIGLLICWICPRSRPDWIKAIGVFFVSISLGLCLLSFCLYDRQVEGYQFVEKLPWVPSIGIFYHVGADGINLTLLLMTCIVCLAGTLVAFSIQERVKEFFMLYLLLISGCLGVLSTLNLFFIYFFYELAVIPVYLLIVLWGSKNKEYAAMKLTLYLTLGALVALLAIFLLFLTCGPAAFDLPALTATLTQHPLEPALQKTAFGFILLGFGVILTLWPFHTWSPIGYAAAPTPVSMLHAGVLKKLGAYLILRLGICLFPAGAAAWMPWIAWIAVINILYCGLIAYRQNDLKFILGYSSCSHMGLILLGLASLNPLALKGVLYFMFAHGLMAALGFALIGSLYDQSRTRDLDAFGGLSKNMPVLSGLFLMTLFASCGVPGFGNFIGEILILFGAFGRYPVQTFLAVSGLLVTAGYLLKLFRLVFQGPPNPRWETLKDPPFSQRIPWLILVSCLVLIGLMPTLLLPTIECGIKPVADILNISGQKVIQP